MIYRWTLKIKNLLLTLRFSILFVFITLFITTTLLITIITTVRYTQSLTYVAFDLMEYASNAVVNELTAKLRPAAMESQFTVDLIERGVLKEEELVAYTTVLVKTLPLIVGTYWGDQQGNFIYSKKENNGTITTEIYNRTSIPATRVILYRDKAENIIKKVSSTDLSYDPRKRPWYLQAQQAKKTIWTDIYYFQPIPDLGITTASPIYKNGQFIGAFGVDIDLSYLTVFIKNQYITPNGFSFIITREGKLIAHPDKKPFTDLSSLPLINVYSKSIPLIDSSLNKYLKSGQKKLTFSYTQNNKTYMVTYEPIEALAAYGWLVGVVVPQTDFTNDLEKMNLITVGISFIILILGIILVSSIISHIVGPIKSLVKETENIKHFNLEGEVPIQSNIKEIIYLRDAVRSMKIGLKLFQKYIPKVLVRQLIESGEDIRVGGVRKQLAVFFSDIESFATIAEKTEPNLLMIQMGEYFEELTQVIINEKGTIDKYIGDSIMAFWGSPLPNEKPCYHAAKAALRCQEKLNELNDNWEKQGHTRLFTRIGIHAGEAIVGNLGSSERLNYTAIGDTINIASRLENINKNYKTRIIVSDAVHEEIKDTFILRMIDCVVVKGRTQSGFIYELLADDITKVSFDLPAYKESFDRGFLCYQEQHWDKAIKHFENCLSIYPQDTVAPVFIERCQHFKTAPPKPDWNGVM
jgi:adenylate cyclase